MTCRSGWSTQAQSNICIYALGATLTREGWDQEQTCLTGSAMLRETLLSAHVSTEILCAAVAKPCFLGKDCFSSEKWESIQNWFPWKGIMLIILPNKSPLGNLHEDSYVLHMILAPFDVEWLAPFPYSSTKSS